MVNYSTIALIASCSVDKSFVWMPVKCKCKGVNNTGKPLIQQQRGIRCVRLCIDKDVSALWTASTYIHCQVDSKRFKQLPSICLQQWSLSLPPSLPSSHLSVLPFLPLSQPLQGGSKARTPALAPALLTPGSVQTGSQQQGWSLRHWSRLSSLQAGWKNTSAFS